MRNTKAFPSSAASRWEATVTLCRSHRATANATAQAAGSWAGPAPDQEEATLYPYHPGAALAPRRPPSKHPWCPVRTHRSRTRARRAARTRASRTNLAPRRTVRSSLRRTKTSPWILRSLLRRSWKRLRAICAQWGVFSGPVRRAGPLEGPQPGAAPSAPQKPARSVVLAVVPAAALSLPPGLNLRPALPHCRR